jgi:hypothetical protein
MLDQGGERPQAESAVDARVASSADRRMPVVNLPRGQRKASILMRECDAIYVVRVACDGRANLL